MSIPLLRYPGSKHQLARWILSYEPPHDLYTESFCGGCAVLLAKDRAPLEAINDKSGDIVNLLRVLRSRPNELIEQIRLTPWATEEYHLAHEAEPAGDELERARRFYLRCWASIRPFDKTPSFRRQKVLSRGRNGQAMTAAAKMFARTEHLWGIVERLRAVTIENMDALDFLELYDHDAAFHYIDPPYLSSTRGLRNHYPHEMMDLDEHGRLADLLLSLKGMVLLSHYPCPEYDDWYLTAGWQRHDCEARINGGGFATESLYINPAATQRLTHADLPLFAQEAA